MTRPRIDVGHLAAVLVLVLLIAAVYVRLGSDRVFRDVRPVSCLDRCEEVQP